MQRGRYFAVSGTGYYATFIWELKP